MRSRADLHAYQETATAFLQENPKSALFVDLGLGKTITALTLLSDLQMDLDSGQALVIAPIRVAKQTWPTEISEWSHVSWLSHTLIRAEDGDEDVRQVFDTYRKRYLGAAKVLGLPPSHRSRWATTFAAGYRDRFKRDKRQRLAATPTMLHIIGIEQVEWLVQHHGKQWPYKTVIIDESSKFKAFDTKRWKALNSVYKYIDRMHLLTATPAPESYMDLWAQIGLLDRGERLGRKITHFRDSYFQQDYDGYGYTLRRDGEEKISAAIADICMVMKAEDYLDLEAPLYLNRYIELPDPIVDMYDDFLKTFILKLTEENHIEACNGAALINKLLQFTGGAVYDEVGEVHEVHDDKIEELRELIEELQGEPLLVAYWYTSSLKRLKKAFPKAVVMDKGGKCVDDWNAGKIPLLFAHPMGSSHGLNMQKGPGHDLAFFDLCWSRELYSQLIGRLARQGQKKVVRVHHLIVRRSKGGETADEIVMQALADKGEGQDKLFRYIKAIRAKTKADSEDDL